MKDDRFPNWHEIYKTEDVKTMPWYTEGLDPDLDQVLKTRHLNKGTFLDLGTGPGTHAHVLCQRGFQVTASDISEAAIERAKTTYSEPIFLVDDILNTKLKGPFDYIFDRGCFHIFNEQQRQTYIKHIDQLTQKDSMFFLKCFSTRESEDARPYRFSKEDIQTLFENLFEIESCTHTIYQGTHEEPPKALFTVMKKLN